LSEWLRLNQGFHTHSRGTDEAAAVGFIDGQLGGSADRFDRQGEHVTAIGFEPQVRVMAGSN
jgi:hypothetical protein